jgi:predicted Rossmann fold flavoprotein
VSGSTISGLDHPVELGGSAKVMRYFDCVIIGGGAAGLMCAATAGKRGKTVAVLDHADKVGKKILMSGGGRCNFTNYNIEPHHYLSANPHFCISALRRYTQYDFLSLVQKYHLEYEEKTLGQLFSRNKSEDILKILLAECNAAGVEIATPCRIEGVEQRSAADGSRFQIATSRGAVTCQSIVIATGGLSMPNAGATGFGHDTAKQFGLRVIPRYATLVPFTLKGDLLTLAQSLAGISMPVTVSCREQSFSEDLLFTHKGLSGPAILQISNYWYPKDVIEIDFLPGEHLASLFCSWKKKGNKRELKSLLACYLPKRFVGAWLTTPEIANCLHNKPIAQYSKADIELLTNHFHRWQCVPSGTEGYKTAEVTRGGVNTEDISSKTFEAKQIPGLFFIGEVLDVTGWLGGYNLQWAWSSGYCAAQYV